MESGKKEFFFPAFHGELIITPFLLQLKNLRRSILLIKNVLFFLDINSLPKFSMANRKCNESVKTHIFIRLYFLNKEKKQIESENSDIINIIEEKRNEFFEEYEMDPPNKDHACKLMNSLAYGDIIELKQCFKKTIKNYENLKQSLPNFYFENLTKLQNSENFKIYKSFLLENKYLNMFKNL